MAYIQEQLTDEERKKQQEQGTGIPLTEQAGAPASGGTVPAGEKEPTGGGGGVKRFTDVRSFLEANRPQAQELAQRVGQKIQTEAQGVQQDIAKTGEEFKSQAEKGAVRLEPARGLIQEAVTRPEDVIKRQEDVQKIAQIRQGQFGGQTALKGTQPYAQLQQRAQEAQRKAGLTETQAGREELLGLTGRPSTGGLMLDQLLLSQTPEARAALQQAGQSATGLGQNLEQTATGAEEFAKQAAAETEQARQLFGEQFGKAKTEFQKQLDERLNQLKAQAQERALKSQQTLATGALDDQALADLGIGKEDLQSILEAQKNLQSDYGLGQDLGEYLTLQSGNYGVGQAATEADLARQQALEELAGEQFGPLRGKVGGANLDLADFASQAAREGTVGTLAARDQALIDRYYNREKLTDAENKALRNALKRQAEYAKGKTFAPQEPGPGLLDVPVPGTPLTVGDVAKVGGEVGKIGEDIGTALDSTFAEPARDIRDETQRAIDVGKGIIGENTSGTIKNVANTGKTVAVDAPLALVQNPKEVIGNIAETAYKAPIEAVKEVTKIVQDPKVAVEAVKEIIKNPTKAVESVTKKVSNTVKKIFCFVTGTEIEMPHGFVKNVEDLDLGDEVKDGGMVISIRKSLVDENVFDYKGVRITGFHAVNEDGKWIRIKDSEHSIPVSYRGEVWSIVTDKHILYSNGILFADETETDNYENLTIDESLDVLNGEIVEVK